MPKLISTPLARPAPSFNPLLTSMEPLRTNPSLESPTGDR